MRHKMRIRGLKRNIGILKTDLRSTKRRDPKHFRNKKNGAYIYIYIFYP